MVKCVLSDDILSEPIPCRGPVLYMGYEKFMKLKAEGKIITIQKDYFLTADEFKNVVSRPWQNKTNKLRIK